MTVNALPVSPPRHECPPLPLPMESSRHCYLCICLWQIRLLTLPSLVRPSTPPLWMRLLDHKAATDLLCRDTLDLGDEGFWQSIKMKLWSWWLHGLCCRWIGWFADRGLCTYSHTTTGDVPHNTVDECTMPVMVRGVATLHDDDNTRREAMRQLHWIP